MKTDLLISKYLDGELGRREDEELRLRLAADPAAKLEFDAAVALHIAMQEESEVDALSDDEFLAIEGAILTAVKPQTATVHHLPPRTWTARRFASAAAAVLVLCSVPVADAYLGNSAENSLALLVPAAQHLPAQPARPRLSGRVRGAQPAVAQQTAEQQQGTALPATVAMNGRGEISETEGIARQTVAAATVAPYNSDVLARSDYRPSVADISRTAVGTLGNAAVPQLPAHEQGRTDAALHALDNAQSTEVQLTTFVSSGLLKVGGNPVAAATSVSQSIGYEISSNGRVGIEVGYTGYTISDGGTIAVPVSTAGGGKRGTVQDAGNEGLPKSPTQSDAPGEYESQTVRFTTDKTVFWGTAFYERTLLDDGNFTLNARLGAGGSPEGPMAFGRAYARYTVLPDVSLTLGAESRVLALQGPMIESLNSETSAGVSVVYGVQVKF